MHFRYREVSLYHPGDQIKSSKMGGVRSTYGAEVRAGFLRGNVRENSPLEDIDVDGRI